MVISAFEHENNTFPWRYLEARGVEVRMARPAPDGAVPVDCYAPLVDARTRVVAAAWVSYGNAAPTSWSRVATRRSSASPAPVSYI